MIVRRWLAPSICVFLSSVLMLACTAPRMIGYSRSSVVCRDLREAPHSRWETTVDGGVHWLLTPCGERFFSLGVNVMDGGEPQRFSNGRIAYHWGTFMLTWNIGRKRHGNECQRGASTLPVAGPCIPRC